METYDPARVVLTFKGHTFTGYAKGTFIKVRRNKELYTLQVGAAGDAARTKVNDKSGQIEITLMQSSPSNDFLTSVAKLDETGLGVGTAQLIDLNGKTLELAERAWLQKMADSEFAEEVGDRVWVLETDRLDHTVGGLNA